ncbi:MAG TPA: hypothetical protein VF796_31105 [Humisphaera sp.]
MRTNAILSTVAAAVPFLAAGCDRAPPAPPAPAGYEWEVVPLPTGNSGASATTTHHAFAMLVNKRTGETWLSGGEAWGEWKKVDRKP